jgi:hypothetical protein
MILQPGPARTVFSGSGVYFGPVFVHGHRKEFFWLARPSRETRNSSAGGGRGAEGAVSAPAADASATVTPAIADEHPIVFFFTTGAVDAPIIVHPCM